jgi:hypothetical protein
MRRLFGDGNEVQMLRQFRDKRLAQSSAGLLLIKLYYQHSAEVSLLLESNPRLAAEAKKLITGLLPALDENITSGRNIVLTKTQHTVVLSLLQMVQEHASPALKQALSSFTRLSGFGVRGWKFSLFSFLF